MAPRLVPRTVDILAAVNTASLLWGLLFGSIGVGFFVYGKRQRMVVPLLCGLALMVYPYFVAGTLQSQSGTLMLTPGCFSTRTSPSWRPCAGRSNDVRARSARYPPTRTSRTRTPSVTYPTGVYVGGPG